MEGSGVAVVLGEGGGETMAAVHARRGAEVEVVGERNIEHRLDG